MKLLLIIIFILFLINDSISQSSILYERQEIEGKEKKISFTSLKFNAFSSIYFIQKNHTNYDSKDEISFQDLDTIQRFASDTTHCIALRHTLSKREYCVKESLLLPKWKLYETEKKILGYNCKLAIAKIDDTKYYAWYCPALIYPYGPNKISGLPGIILELYDEKKQLLFIYPKEINLGLHSNPNSNKENTLNCTKTISLKEFQAILQGEIDEHNGKIFDLIDKQ